MYLFCPRCNSQHLASSRCPRCSSRLLSPGEAQDVLSASPAAPPPPAQPTAAGRVVVGTLVALGVHLALREGVQAGVNVAGGIDSMTMLWANFALRAVGAVVGGMLAGGGRKRGFANGVAVGVVSALAWLGFDAFPDWLFDLTRLAAAGSLVVGGGIAAALGGWLWPPPVEVKVPEQSRGSSLLRLKPTAERKTTRPVGWVRVIAGATLAVCGVLLASEMRLAMTKMPQGFFNNLTGATSARIDGLLAGFAVVLAGVVAGAANARGWRQGLIAGAFAAVGVMAAGTLPAGPPPAVTWTADALGFGYQPQQGAAVVGAVVLTLMTAAGWFGGQLFPVLSQKKRLGE